jgi:phosphoribosylamine--glycine ligase
VLCSKGYPDIFKKNIEIENLQNINLGLSDYLFHGGTSKNDNKIFAVGGRVLNFVSLSNDFSEAKKNIINNLDILNWPGGFYRKDIGYKVIN